MSRAAGRTAAELARTVRFLHFEGFRTEEVPSYSISGDVKSCHRNAMIEKCIWNTDDGSLHHCCDTIHKSFYLDIEVR